MANGDGDRPPESKENRVEPSHVYEFLAGAAGVGIGLTSLVQYVLGDTPFFPTVLPTWVWLLTGALVLMSLFKSKPVVSRVSDGAMAIFILAGVAAARLPDPHSALAGQSLSLVAWGGIAVIGSRRRVASGLGRSGLPMAVAAGSAGLLPWWWKLAPLVAILGIVLWATWVLDRLDSEDGRTDGGKARGEGSRPTTRCS